jgi:hypothetical protein
MRLADTWILIRRQDDPHKVGRGGISPVLRDRRGIHLVKRVCSPRDDLVAIRALTAGIIPLSAELLWLSRAGFAHFQ